MSLLSNYGIKPSSVEDGPSLDDDFTGTSLDTAVWSIKNPGDGSVSVVNGELNLAGTGGSHIAVYSKEKFPVGTKVIARSRGVQNRHHALIGFGTGPNFFPYPHGDANTFGFTWYGRADSRTSTISWRNENGTVGYIDPAPVNNVTSYQIFELHRISASEVRVYRNGSLLSTVTGLNLPSDAHVFVSCDRFYTPNKILVDYIKVEEI